MRAIEGGHRFRALTRTGRCLRRPRKIRGRWTGGVDTRPLAHSVLRSALSSRPPPSPRRLAAAAMLASTRMTPAPMLSLERSILRPPSPTETFTRPRQEPNNRLSGRNSGSTFSRPSTTISNPLELGAGSQANWGTFPVGNLSWAAPVGDLPFRVTASVRSEFRRFFNELDADVDRLTFSGRVQYVDATNDQAFSPYFAITPRFAYSRPFRTRRRRGRTSI